MCCQINVIQWETNALIFHRYAKYPIIRDRFTGKFKYHVERTFKPIEFIMLMRYVYQNAPCALFKCFFPRFGMCTCVCFSFNLLFMLLAFKLCNWSCWIAEQKNKLNHFMYRTYFWDWSLFRSNLIEFPLWKHTQIKTWIKFNGWTCFQNNQLNE